MLRQQQWILQVLSEEIECPLMHLKDGISVDLQYLVELEDESKVDSLAT